MPPQTGALDDLSSPQALSYRPKGLQRTVDLVERVLHPALDIGLPGSHDPGARGGPVRNFTQAP